MKFYIEFCYNNGRKNDILDIERITLKELINDSIQYNIFPIISKVKYIILNLEPYISIKI